MKTEIDTTIRKEAMEKLSRSAWVKTPYAKSSAGNPDASIQSLLGKYNCDGSQFTNGRGPNGRRGVMVRFRLDGHTYRIQVEALNAEASEVELVTQAKRAIFWMLKSLLESVGVFFTKEQALFTFLELPDASGATTFEIASPRLGTMKSAEFLLHFQQSNHPQLTHQKEK